MKKIISLICVLAIICSCWYLISEFIIPESKATKTYNTLANSLIQETSEEENLKEEYKRKYPDIDFPEGMLLKYYPAYVQNQDLKGWISIPELKIDYPIVQGTDNLFYLTHDINKEYFAWGVPFFNTQNAFNPNSRNLLVFGHNSRYNKTKMFAPLDAYLTPDGFKKAPVIRCDTIFEEMYWKVYAVYITNSKAENDNGYIFNYLLSDFPDNTFEEYIQEIDKRAIYTTGVDICTTDKLLTLSTCNYSFSNARLVILCRQVRQNETLEVNFDSVRQNKNPRYPQSWYSVHKIPNPYKNDSNWYPLG